LVRSTRTRGTRRGRTACLAVRPAKGKHGGRGRRFDPHRPAVPGPEPPLRRRRHGRHPRYDPRHGPAGQRRPAPVDLPRRASLPTPGPARRPHEQLDRIHHQSPLGDQRRGRKEARSSETRSSGSSNLGHRVTDAPYGRSGTSARFGGAVHRRDRTDSPNLDGSSPPANGAAVERPERHRERCRYRDPSRRDERG
jgi:hypothetical protein